MSTLASPRTLRYGDHPSQYVEMYLPKATATTNESTPTRGCPVAVVLHGGYWRAKYDLSLMHALCDWLSKQGWLVWNVEYRRVGDVQGVDNGWPVLFEDVARAIDMLKEFPLFTTNTAADATTTVAGSSGHPRDAAKVENVGMEAVPDLSRVVSIGHSAGGHLAMWAAVRQTLPSGAPGSQPLVPITGGVVALAPAADLTDVHARGLSDTAVRGLLGGDPLDLADIYDLASPAARLPLLCPTLLLHGDADDDLPIDCSRKFCEKVVTHAATAKGGGDVDATATGDAVTYGGPNGKDVRCGHLDYRELSGADHFVVIDPQSQCWRVALEWMNLR